MYHAVSGAGGVRLNVCEAGPEDGASILFVHGWAQSHLCWARQFDSALADRYRLVAMDLRGHGMSEAPPDVGAYTDPAIWGRDVAAVIEQRRLRRPVIVGWSYGGFVTCDYIRSFGTAAIAGVNFVGWGVMMGRTESELKFVGRGWHDFYAGTTSDDLDLNIAATRGFVRACVASEPPAAELETVLAYNMIVTPFVRRAMTMRPPDDFTPVLATLAIPVLATQGLADTITLPIATGYLASVCPVAEASYYERVGHSPFMEAPERFNVELARFVDRANKPSARVSNDAGP